MFENLPYHVDYIGQKNGEKLFQVIIVVFAIVGFFVGYVYEQLSYSMIVLGIGCLIAALLTLPPWPMYRRNPIAWQVPTEEKEPTSYTALPKSKSGKKKN